MSGTVDIPVIKTPPPSGGAVESLSDFLKASGDWHNKYSEPDTGMLSNLWYRGVSEPFDYQAPGVYRKAFTERAMKLSSGKDLEDKRLRLERDMISNFRTAGAAFLSNYSEAEMYFSAQHFGMPTRLLDWSTNPLAALFFACEEHEDKDGFVYAMNSTKVIPDDATKRNGEKLWPSVMLMRNPIVESAVGASFWRPLDTVQKPYVLPVRPDVIPGRIGQQSSCFTFHMHRAAPVDKSTLTTIQVSGSKKGVIRDELHRVNINQFTTYHDLDHLTKEIRRDWGL
jgi:hypothetical protein